MMRHHTKGFTLIETLVYLALFAIIMGGIVSAAYSLFESGGRNQSKAMMQEEKNFLVAKINSALEGAKTISVPAANTSSSTLTVLRYDGSTASIGQTATSGAMWFTSSNNLISNSNVKISKVTFIHRVPGGTNPEYIEAGLTITATIPQGMTISQTASTTRYLHI
jgi:prepilin-type N-terminal cleavage/methylation domain-containing protein